MRGKYGTPVSDSSGFGQAVQLIKPDRPSRVGSLRIQGSVRELERISTNLQRAGEHRVTESIDLRIISLLEKKICRKILAQSRR
jgi:hypothetical protein